eukprot:2374009-Lingulodinium_polyedra.AAC.1
MVGACKDAECRPPVPGPSDTARTCDKQVSIWRHISCHIDKNRYYTLAGPDLGWICLKLCVVEVVKL